jgi:hypothetical protein
MLKVSPDLASTNYKGVKRGKVGLGYEYLIVDEELRLDHVVDLAEKCLRERISRRVR